MTTTTIPNMPLPPGADGACGWDQWDNEFRVFHTADQEVGGHVVYASGVQCIDGTVSTDDAPMVWVQGGSDERGLTGAQARDLAAVLIQAADIIDRWVNR